MSTFLLEIGTEEMPADFARLALPHLDQLVLRDLKQLRLNHGDIHCTSTPRRLVLLIEDLAARAENLEEERKGPPVSQAFKDGSPTQAAIGFAKRCGVEVESLQVRETLKGPFVFAKVIEIGAPTTNLLKDQIPKWIGSLQGRRFMRWGSGERRFSRPVRWLVALLDETLIPLCLAGSDPEICTGKVSRGHRLLNDQVEISSADCFSDVLKEVGVEISRKKRLEFIRTAVNEASTSLQARADLPEDLLEELADLVELPSLIEGDIEESFLELPSEVLSTVMRVHQRYIPLYRAEALNDPLALDAKHSLLPRFLCIANSLDDAADFVKSGNERVLKARLADAKFFVDADLAITSKQRCEQLDKVTFSEGLGSLLDRVNRIKWLAKELVHDLNLSGLNSGNVKRAADLCKHDLVSQIIGEFPELQGIMGAKYLLAEGEEREVALAVMEHYLPKGYGDSLPESDAGSLLAIAERIELIISIFAKGERPSGSSDPYALRRAGNGLIQILWHKDWGLDLISFLEKALLYWEKLLPDLDFNVSLLASELAEFLRQRIVSLLEELGTDVDIVQSVAGETVSTVRSLSDPVDTKVRAELLGEMRRSGKLLAVQAVVTRAARLAVKSNLSPILLDASKVVCPDLFEKSCEEDMFAVIKSLEPIVKAADRERYALLADGLVKGSEALSAFFDGEQSVMVMVEDSKVRNNRLNMLGVLRNQAWTIADFSQIVGG